MMRMLAWIDLLQTNGYINKVLSFVGLGSPDWLGGHWYTVILGLVYGYIPYLILVLYAGLDRIDPSLIEAGRDLGLSRTRTFLRVTLPLSRQPILTGMLITVLPMLGDYYNNRLRPWRNPWRKPWLLESFTWLYLIWSLVPIALAVLFSFNNGKSQAVWQGFSWRWYFTDPVNSVWHNPALHAAVFQTLRLSVYTTIIAVPLGVAFALGINRWRSYTSSTFNFVMILSFVVPELIFGVAMFFVFTVLFSFVHLGTLAETLGLVSWNISWHGIIVQARLVTIGKH